MSQPDLTTVDWAQTSRSELKEIAREWGSYWIVVQTSPPTNKQVGRAIGDAFEAAGKPLQGYQRTRYAQYALEFLAADECDTPRDLEHMRTGMVRRQQRLATRAGKAAEALMPTAREILRHSDEPRDCRQAIQNASDLAKVATNADGLTAKILHLDKLSPEQSLSSREARDEVLSMIERALPDFDDDQKLRLLAMVEASRVDVDEEDDLVDDLGIIPM